MTRHSAAFLSMLALGLIIIFVLGIVSAPAVGLASDNETPTPEADGEAVAESPFENFDPTTFDNSTTIDNAWLPLQPGMQYIYEGFTTEDGETIPHRVITTVTDLIKEIDGVRTVVIWDQDFSDGELVETEIAFFAQDNDGNVWRIGEYPEEYEEGELVDAPAWITGQEEAVAGIAMKADPQPDTGSYSQGWAPAVEFTDRAQVAAVGQETCVPFDCYTDVLVTDEFNPEEPGAFQQKYYAKGNGLVRVGWRGENEQTQEVLELVDVVELDSDAMADARAAALELEQRAYEMSQEIYGQTSPAQAAMAED